MNNLELSEQEIIRRQSLDELRNMGIEPYPAALYEVNAWSAEIKDAFNDETERRQVSIAGRIMGRRIMGKASFVELMDAQGRIQVYITRDDICTGEDKELYNTVFKRLTDIGDFIGITGYVFRTKTGEISVHAETMTILSKSLKPLPVVKVKDGVTFDKFSDPEMRYRQRYVDLLVNDGVRVFVRLIGRAASQRLGVWRRGGNLLDGGHLTVPEAGDLRGFATRVHVRGGPGCGRGGGRHGRRRGSGRRRRSCGPNRSGRWAGGWGRRRGRCGRSRRDRSGLPPGVVRGGLRFRVTHVAAGVRALGLHGSEVRAPLLRDACLVCQVRVVHLLDEPFVRTKIGSRHRTPFRLSLFPHQH